jgi:hypothetical protein
LRIIVALGRFVRGHAMVALARLELLLALALFGRGLPPGAGCVEGFLPAGGEETLD